jgi:sensor histidine kinase YesM
LNLFKRILLIDVTVGTVGCLLMVSLYQAAREQIFHQFAHSMVTAFFVATPACLLISRYWWKMSGLRFPANWASVVAMILACAAVGNVAHNLVFVALGSLPPSEFWNVFWVRVQFSTTIALVFGVGAFLFRILRDDLETTALELRTQQLREERARKLAVQAQLASLESHVRPHFLFNALNTISSLIPEDPKLAETLLGRLAGVLRLSLDSNQQSLAPLDKELKLVGDYLEIERARFGNRLRFEIDVPSQLRSIEVPALSLQTLVENSVKYAVAAHLDGASIRVTASTRNGLVHLKVSDDGPGFTSQAIRPGHGLANLQGRLAALFGDSAKLEVARAAGLTAVTLSLPRSQIQAAV